MAKFGFILSKSPHVGNNLNTLYRLAAAALDKEHEVFVYLNYDGIFGPLKNQRKLNGDKTPREMIGELVRNGAEVMCSSLDVGVRGIDSNKAFIDGVSTGELSDLSEKISRLDRLISL